MTHEPTGAAPVLLLRRAPEDAPMVTSDGIDVSVLREEHRAHQEAAAIRALGLAIWELREADVIRNAVGTLDPSAHLEAEPFIETFTSWVFSVGQGIDVEPMTLLGRVVDDPERVNGDIADLADTHPAVATFDDAEEEFRRVWENEEGKQRTEYVSHAQQRATELHPGAIVRPWLPSDAIQPDPVSEAATRELRDACESYARDHVQIIGTPFASGTVESDQVVAHWDQAGLTWQRVLADVTAKRRGADGV